MKKISYILLSLVALGCATSAMAQNSRTKDKETEGKEVRVMKVREHKFVLPKAGDVALGIDVVPMLGYFGNMFNGSTSNGYNSFGGEPTLKDEAGNPINNPTVSIMGRYMITDHFAAQFNLGFLYRHNKNRLYSLDDKLLMENPLSEAKVIDEEIINSTGFSLSVGAQYRRGYRRIQGYAGGSLIYGFGEYNKHYKYGNAITEINQTPSREFATATTLPTPTYWTRNYILSEYNDRSNQYFGLGVNVGVEIFLASHFSIGGEVYLSAIWKDGSARYAEQEGFSTVSNKVEKRTELLSPGDFAFIFGTQNLGGKLYLMFYF